MRVNFWVSVGAFALLFGLISPFAHARAFDCRDEPSHRSGTGAATVMQFQNNSSIPVLVYWLDHSGVRKLYRRLAPGEAYSQPTYVSHAWIFADTSGRCLRGAFAQSGATTFTHYNASVDRPAPNAGSEKIYVGDHICLQRVARGTILCRRGQRNIVECNSLSPQQALDTLADEVFQIGKCLQRMEGFEFRHDYLHQLREARLGTINGFNTHFSGRTRNGQHMNCNSVTRAVVVHQYRTFQERNTSTNFYCEMLD